MDDGVGNGSNIENFIDNEEFVEDGDYSDRLEIIQAQMKEMAEKEREVAERQQEECRVEMQERLRNLEDTIKTDVSNMVHNVEERYRVHTTDIVGNRQTEILRANKVIREVARGLGSDWRWVFKFIMAGFPKEVIDIELEKLERVKPFMQAYKALTTWKEYKADEFDIRQLIKALQENLKTDLANLAVEIMNSEGDCLIKLTSVGKGIASGVEDEDDVTENGGQNENGEGPSLQERKKSLKDHESVTGKLGDTKFLHIARQLGDDWTNVGNMLQLPEEELQELQELNDTRQAAFRMLFSWRESNDDKLEEDLVQQLTNVLKRSGRQELAELFTKDSQA